MKTNEELEFKSVHAPVESGSVDDCHTADLTVGIKDRVYRAYATIYYHDQNASAEGVEHTLCGRGETAEEAMTEVLTRAEDQWDDDQARGLRYAAIGVKDEIDEHGSTYPIQQTD